MTYLIVVLSILVRFFPHPWNFSPVFGALLFGGAHLRRRDSVWFPVALLALSDVVLTLVFHQMAMRWQHLFVWTGFTLIAVLGWWVRQRYSASRVLTASVVGPVVFYLISNFGVWMTGALYPPTWEGLALCYLAAIPYLRNSLLSSVLFTAVLFGSYAYFQKGSRHTQSDESLARAR